MKALVFAPLSRRDALVACDPRGRDTSSSAGGSALARQWPDIGLLRNCGRRAWRGLLARAEARIAFGSATWPHMLFRAMLAEQLYRATTILAVTPITAARPCTGAVPAV